MAHNPSAVGSSPTRPTVAPQVSGLRYTGVTRPYCHPYCQGPVSPVLSNLCTRSCSVPIVRFMTQDRVKGAALFAIVGAVLTVVGVLQPWIKVESGFGELSRSGLDYSGDAKVILVLAIIAGLAGLGALTQAQMPSFFRPSLPILGAIGTALAVYDYNQVKDKVNNEPASITKYASANIGSGMYMTIVGCVLILLAGLALWTAAKESPAEPAREDVTV